MSGCHFGKNPNADDAYWAYRNGLHQSKFSIFARGDDPASSRMYDALELGVPQMMLSDLYMGLVAAFQCKVDWDQLVCKISEEQFNSSPVVTMSKVLDAVMGGTGKDPEAVWRQMWEATMNYRDDLLWSSKNSRVGHNLLEEIGRRCTTGARKGIWDSYSQRKKEARR